MVFKKSVTNIIQIHRWGFIPQDALRLKIIILSRPILNNEKSLLPCNLVSFRLYWTIYLIDWNGLTLSSFMTTFFGSCSQLGYHVNQSELTRIWLNNLGHSTLIERKVGFLKWRLQYVKGLFDRDLSKVISLIFNQCMKPVPEGLLKKGMFPYGTSQRLQKKKKTRNAVLRLCFEKQRSTLEPLPSCVLHTYVFMVKFPNRWFAMLGISGHILWF